MNLSSFELAAIGTAATTNHDDITRVEDGMVGGASTQFMPKWTYHCHSHSGLHWNTSEVSNIDCRLGRRSNQLVVWRWRFAPVNQFEPQFILDLLRVMFA
jgi:hypothetical protein